LEEVFGWIGTVAAHYGWHCLIFEGPGQWTALKANPGLLFRPDYEKPVAAVVDYLFTRPDVDQDKVALVGYSFFTGSIRPSVGKSGTFHQIQQRIRHSSKLSRSTGEKKEPKRLKRFSRTLDSSEESSQFRAKCESG
jgi:hypothetical protein